LNGGESGRYEFAECSRALAYRSQPFICEMAKTEGLTEAKRSASASIDGFGPFAFLEVLLALLITKDLVSALYGFVTVVTASCRGEAPGGSRGKSCTL